MKNKILEKYREVQTETSWSAYKVTCHILKSNESIAESFGSGVFVKADENHFLITAAHVAEGLNYELFVGIDNDTIFRLGGNIVTNNVEGQRENDRFDLCVLKLCEETVETIKKSYDFLDKSELGINHISKELPMYEIVGFPTTKSKYNKFKKQLKSKAWRYITNPVKRKNYETLKCNKDFNIVLNYDRKRVFNFKKETTQIGPELYGISGCGLWFTPPKETLTKGQPEKRLVAIMTEWPINNRKFLIATKIDLFTEIIRQKYNCDVPKSTILKLNIN